jgi:8-oxo-dGTP pyrophosphatase MutT (NUDIX family)
MTAAVENVSDKSTEKKFRHKRRGKTILVGRGSKLAAQKIRGRIRVEISAGGIVFKRTPKGVRVALLLDPFGKWAFAKGHRESGETINQAAIRETMEEMGLPKLRIRSFLGKIDFWFHDRYRPATRGVLIHKYVHLFLMEAPAGVYGKPQKKEKIRRIIWVPLDKLRSKSSYVDMQPIIDRAVNFLQKYQK